VIVDSDNASHRVLHVKSDALAAMARVLPAVDQDLAQAAVPRGPTPPEGSHGLGAPRHDLRVVDYLEEKSEFVRGGDGCFAGSWCW